MTSHPQVCVSRPRKNKHGYEVAEKHCEPIAAIESLLPRTGMKSKCGSCWVWLVATLLGLFILLHIGAFVDASWVARINKVGKTVSYFIGRNLRYQLHITSSNYTYPGIIPPYASDLQCLFSDRNQFDRKFLSTPASLITPEYPFCLAISIGDDTDRPHAKALPYPLAHRLFEKLKEEMDVFREGGLNTEEVQVLVGVDYPSIVCRMFRDFVNDSLPGVKGQCGSFDQLTPGMKCGKLITGHTQRFVPQMSSQWAESVEWESHRLVDLDCMDPSRNPPAIPEEDWQPTIVTGFSSNHLAVGLLMLRSVGKAAKEGSDGLFNISLVVWAMEVFIPEHQQLLDCVIDELNHEYGVRAEVRLFNFSAYPPWMRINQELRYFGGTGEYAWKAVMVHTILVERGFVVWADAGDRFHDTDSLINTLKVLKERGFVSRSSHGTVWTRTHPLHLKYYRASLPGIWDLENCEAAIVGFTLKKYTEIARPWYDCAMVRQCIAPDGSDRSNHRQDQAALTILSILSKNPCTGAHPHFAHHMDDDPSLKNVSGTYTTTCYVDPLPAYL